jgi:hypothetical protein
MNTHIDIVTAWNQHTAEGLMKNIFISPTGNLEAGLRLSDNGPEQYVIECDSGKNISEPPQFTRFKNGFEMIFNPFGALKPGAPSMSLGRQDDLPTGAIACVMACQDQKNPLSILKRPSLLQATLPQSTWLAFPNVTPWESRGLILWIPGASNKMIITLPHQPQILTRRAVEDFLEISSSSTQFTTFFNALHGGASANHLHFQSAYSDHAMAVELATRIPRGKYMVTEGYCAPALVFPKNVAADTLWKPIEKIQAAGHPLNLIALTSGVYLFIRDHDHEIVAEFPGRGLGTINLAGLMITSDKNDFTRVTEETIASAFTKTTIDPKNLDWLFEA